jgi:hypothetical protein
MVIMIVVVILIIVVVMVSFIAYGDGSLMLHILRQAITNC